MKDKILKNKKVIIPIVSILLILVIVGVSFAYYSATVNKVNETETTIRTNGLAIIFNGTKEINYQNNLHKIVYKLLKVFYIFAMTWAAITLVSCDKFLTRNPENKISAELFLSTENDKRILPVHIA